MSPNPPPSELSPGVIAEVAGGIIAVVTALSYLVRLGKLVQLLETLAGDVSTLTAEVSAASANIARHSAELSALRRDVDDLRERIA